MVNVAHASITASVAVDVLFFLTGTTRGKIGFKQRAANPGLPNPVMDVFDAGVAATYVDDGVADTAHVATAHPAVENVLQTYTGIDWFEKVHIVPRTTIDFGNIVTLVENAYEIYSAHRTQAVTLQLITNNALPGVELPNLSAPTVVEPQSSILDPTTTSNNGGTGLGTLVQMKLQATQAGLPAFTEALIDFDFALPGNDVFLLVSGSRVVLIPFEFEGDMREVLRFKTDIIGAISGKEQNRISDRKQPRQGFDVSYFLEGESARRMQLLMLDWLGQVFGFPLWHETVRLTAAVSVGATSYPVSGADQVDLRVGGYAAVIQDDSTYDVIVIASFTATTITASDPSVNGYAAGTRIMPMRVAYVTRDSSGSRPPVNVIRQKIQVEVTDNDTGALVGSTTPGFWSTHNGRVLLDDCNVIRGEARHTDQRRVYEIDNDTGLVYQATIWDRAKRGYVKGFSLRGRADMLSFRKLLYALRGRQTALYVATHFEDLLVVANVTIGSATLDIESIDYRRFARERAPTDRIRVTFTDGTQLFRTVDSSATVSVTVERLTLASTWPANRTIAEFLRVEFIDLVRFDADEFTIVHERAGLARCEAPLIRVFDDD